MFQKDDQDRGPLGTFPLGLPDSHHKEFDQRFDKAFGVAKRGFGLALALVIGEFLVATGLLVAAVCIAWHFVAKWW